MGRGPVTPLLEARAVTVRFGGVVANAAVDLTIDRGRLVGLIGSNGAGKSTFVDAISGLVPLSDGTVVFDGADIGQDPPEVRARRGMIRTFQSLELFEDLTVRDNLLVSFGDEPWWQIPRSLLRQGRPKHVDEQVEGTLVRLGLEALAEALPRELSHGQRKLVALARALVAEPKLVLLDEPAAGLDATESAELGKVLRGLLDHGVTVLLIDHDMGLVLSICDEVYVLDFGEVVAHGTPAEVRSDPAVISAYLGGESTEVADQVNHYDER
jgi:branched-chain amino acid transport system ATP-binding protein